MLIIKNNKNRQLIFFVVFIAVLLVLVGIYLLYKSSKLKELNELLAERRVFLIEKNNDLDSLNKLLIESSKEKENLLKVNNKLFSIISHDLKSPLDSLSGFINLAMYKDFSKEKLMEVLSGIKKSTQYTLYLLENLVNWSISQANEFKLFMKEQELQKVLEMEIGNGFALAQSKNIVLETQIQHDPIILKSDKDVIQLVFRNLFVNAVKFTKPKGCIFIEVFSNPESACFVIRDTGIGIPKDKIENLSSLSAKRSYGTQNEKGTGLGLPLCFEFVKNLGGSLKIESEEGKGTKVTCTLPLS